MNEQYSVLRRMNQQLYTKGREFHGNMPVHIRVSLLESCNLRCYMCHLSALPDEQLQSLSKEVMEENVFYALAKDAFPFAEKVTFGFAGQDRFIPVKKLKSMFNPTTAH